MLLLQSSLQYLLLILQMKLKRIKSTKTEMKTPYLTVLIYLHVQSNINLFSVWLEGLQLHGVLFSFHVSFPCHFSSKQLNHG